MLREPAMWMSSPLHTRPLFFFLLHDVSTSRPKRDCLLFVARHTAVALTRNAPLSRAQSPGISVSSVEPSGVFLSRFWLSSSRSLGRCLLLGQRSRLNFLSYLIGSLFHQHYRDSHTELSRHRNDGHPASQVACMGLTHRAEKLSQLPVLTDRRPGGLDELTSKPPVSRVGDRSSIGSLSGRVLRRHQAQESPQLVNVFKLSPIPDASHKLTGYNPTNPGNRHQILNTLGQLGVIVAEAADLSSRLKNLLLRKLQTVEQLIELKAHGLRTLKLSQLLLDHERPLPAGGCRGKLDPFEEQQRFDALLHSHHLAHKGIAQLSQVTQLPVQRRGNVDAFELSPTQVLRQSPTVEPIGLHSLSWSFGDHRWRGDQAGVGFRHQPIIQSVPRRSSLVGKGHLLIAKVLAHMVHKMLHAIGHTQGTNKSLMIGEGHRDAPLVDVQSAKHLVIRGLECFAFHRCYFDRRFTSRRRKAREAPRRLPCRRAGLNSVLDHR